MRLLSLLLSLLALIPTSAQAPREPEVYAALERQAEASYAEKSFGRARELYEQASKLALAPAQKRWVEMRLADTAWRADAANPGADSTRRDEAQKALESLIGEAGNDHDRVWAEANESLGDLHWMHRYAYDIGAALPYYLAALDWWAGSEDLTLARQRYLAVVFRMTENGEQSYGRGIAYIGAIPREILVNAVSIAGSAADRTHARYLLAMRLLAEPRPESVERALELLDQVIAAGKSSSWFDDALFAAAQRLVQGSVVVQENGETAFKPNYAKALDLYRRILSEFRPGETRDYEQAKAAIDAIVSPVVAVMVAGTFLPRSEQEINLSWRNVKEVELTITAVDLFQDTSIAAANYRGLADTIRTEGRAPLRRWSYETNDRGDHAPGNAAVRLTPKLEPGAYAVQASAEGKSSRQLILVTDATIVMHQASGRSDVFVCDAITGQPIAGARIRVWQQVRSQNSFISGEAHSDANGVATIRFGVPVGGSTVVAASAPNNRQAWLSSWTYGNPDRQAEWRIYAFTDRPAYRPEETVHWKFFARTREENRWITPAKATIDYEIVGPRNDKVASGKATLNDFGSFWSDLPLTPSMALGVYTINFRKSDAKNNYEFIGQAQLFRLEEYKLPEFRVSVTTPEENGRRKQYRLGDTVEATIEAEYYFGGPVANAGVQVVIFERPLVHFWSRWREYPWYYRNPEYGFGRQIRSEALTTDAHGRATLRLETSGEDQDSQFRIEARVTDASRREVIGEGDVRVTRQRYSIIAEAEHSLLRPGEKASIAFKAIDANDQPVQTTGTVKVTRQRWEEIWIDAAGHEVTGRELERARSLMSVFRPPWRRRFAGYREEEVLSTSVSTDAKGEAALTFNVLRDGYYVVRWTSEDRDPGRPARARDLVAAQTAVWVSETASIDLGYHAAGLEIIVDKESFRAGQTAAAMIVTPASGRWVMLTTSADGILDTQMLHLDGTVKLVQIALDDRHTPSFYLTASSVFDRTLATTLRTIVVPPVEHFIHVEVKPDREQYEPRQEGSVTISTRDVDGKPIAAEVALSVSDESVTAIQNDPAGDPRQFFFGQLRGYGVQVGASVQTQSYLMLVEEEGKLIDDRLREQRRRAERARNEAELDEYAGGVEGGGVGAMVGGVTGGIVPPPAAKASVAESITVTRQAPVSRDFQALAMEVIVRSDFRSTAFWQPNVMTGANGTAKVTLRYPEALTTWRATARAVSSATQIGMGSATARTNMPLMVRLQAPRFFVAGDRATVSAVINNDSDEAMRVTPSVIVEGLTPQSPATAAAIDVPPHGESRADWIVVAERAGTAKVRVTARTESRGDAMEKTFAVYEHGVDKLIGRSGKLRGSEAIIRLDLPHERRGTAVTVRIQPSIAVAMLDALPYLIDYPYGCTEQTMSRFLPAAIVARTLTRNGFRASDIEGHLFGGIERQHAGATHPAGAKDLRLLETMTDASMARLYDFQHSEGGWGWWKDGDSDDFMTAYVVWGFSVAREAGLAVNENAVRRAVFWLDRRLVQSEERYAQQTWMLHGIAAWRAATHDKTITADERRALDNVWEHRERLTAYSRALFALATHDFGDAQRAAILTHNLEDGVKLDRTPDQSVLVRAAGASPAETMATAHWGEDRFWWHWYDGPVESTAFALQALVLIDPQNRLIEPAMNWLVKNRRGAQWNNTRDSAIAILALNDYLGASGELKGDVAYELSFNGAPAGSQPARSGLLGRTFTIDSALVRDRNEIRIRRTGGNPDSPIYFAAEAKFVSLEEPVRAAGNEIFVRRDYFRLAPRPTLLKGISYEREPLRDNGSIDSGDRIEVVDTIETKNDYDYLMFEDLKPAGVEAVSLQSGEGLVAHELRSGAVAPGKGRPPKSTDQTYRTAWVYQELRDRKVALFIDHLPQGVWEIRYTLRAEVPGFFHALPLLGQAMYVPEIHANGEEVCVTVNDRR